MSTKPTNQTTHLTSLAPKPTIMKVFITAPSYEAFSKYWKSEKLDPNKVFFCETTERMDKDLTTNWDQDIKSKGVVVNEEGRAIGFHDLKQDKVELNYVRTKIEDHLPTVDVKELVEGHNNLVGAITELQAQNRELWEYVTSKTEQDCAKNAQTEPVERDPDKTRREPDVNKCEHDIEVISLGGSDSNPLPVCKKCGDIIVRRFPPKSYTIAELREKAHEYSHLPSSGYVGAQTIRELIFIGWLEEQEGK